MSLTAARSDPALLSCPVVRDPVPAPLGGTRPVLSARFLGGFWVTIDHVAVPLGSSRRTRALLAFLIDRGARPVPRDVLMEAFWPASTPEAARNSLHVAMCGVRKALAQVWTGVVIECRGDTYRLSDEIDVWTDVAELERRCDQAALVSVGGAHRRCDRRLRGRAGALRRRVPGRRPLPRVGARTVERSCDCAPSRAPSG